MRRMISTGAISGGAETNMWTWIFADNASQFLNLKPFADLAHQITDSHGKVALKNLVTIFRYPHKMVLDLVLGVAATAVVHASFLKATAS